MKAASIRGLHGGRVHWGPVLRFLLAALVGLAVVSLAAGSVPPATNTPGDFDELREPGKHLPRATVSAPEQQAPEQQPPEQQPPAKQPQRPSYEPRGYGYPPQNSKPAVNKIWVDPYLLAIAGGLA